MHPIAHDLQDLEKELGDQAYLLQHLPLNELIIAPTGDDSQALSFRIHFGYITDKRSGGDPKTRPSQSRPESSGNDTQNVWIHMIPASRPGASLEMQFHTYDSKDVYIDRADGENIGRVVSGCMHAFRLPTAKWWTKSKLIALAKYYFLCRMADTERGADRDLFHFGMPITKSFKDDLKSICWDYEKNTRRNPGTEVTRTAVSEQLDQEGSDLSDVPEVLMDEEDVRVMGNVSAKPDPATPNQSVLQAAEGSDPPSLQDIAKDLVELQDKEKALADDIENIEQRIRILKETQHARKEEQRGLKRRKVAIFKDLTVEVAYNLGQQVERASAQKNQRLGRE